MKAFNRTAAEIAVATALFGTSAVAFAGPAVDFSTLSSNDNYNPVTMISTVTLGDITADALLYNGGTSYSTSYLWVRNTSWPGDDGLGVCSEGKSNCVNGGGDTNELDNLGNNEVIRLTNGTGNNWQNVFLSSLDNNGGGATPPEQATIYWSNSSNADLSTASHITISAGSVSGWAAGQVEGSILADLSSGGFDASSQYLYFAAGPSGNNNDYLVWGVTAVPEPETYAMLMAGLGLMGFMARRRRQQSDAA